MCFEYTLCALSISFTISCNIKITHFFGEFISRHISKSNRITSIIGGIRHFHCSTTHTPTPHIYGPFYRVIISRAYTHIFERYFNKELKQRTICFCFWLLGGGQIAARQWQQQQQWQQQEQCQRATMMPTFTIKKNGKQEHTMCTVYLYLLSSFIHQITPQNNNNKTTTTAISAVRFIPKAL